MALLHRGAHQGLSETAPGDAGKSATHMALGGIEHGSGGPPHVSPAPQVDLATDGGFAEDRALETALDGSPRVFATGVFSHYSTLLRLGGNTLSSIWGVFLLGDDEFAARDPERKEDEGGGKAAEGPRGRRDQKDKQQLILGLPKLAWALIADIVAMLCFVACIPFVLTVAKRRRSAAATTT